MRLPRLIGMAGLAFSLAVGAAAAQVAARTADKVKGKQAPVSAQPGPFAGEPMSKGAPAASPVVVKAGQERRKPASQLAPAPAR